MLLGSTGRALALEVWWHAREILPLFSRTTPVLAVLVAGSAGRYPDAETAQDELRLRKWWRGAVALQSHKREVSVWSRGSRVGRYALLELQY